MILNGTVVSGRGVATGYLDPFARDLKELTGNDLFPGTMNVVLDRPVRFSESHAVKFDLDRRLIWPATLEGVSVFMYRWAECPLHVLEILSEVHLRRLLCLSDDSTVELVCEDKIVSPLSRKEALIWRILWRGRERAAYDDSVRSPGNRELRYLGGMQASPKGLARYIPSVLRDCGRSIRKATGR